MKKEKVIVIGGGFAGIEIIKHLNKIPTLETTLIDLNNYNFFPPLLYQVATGFMEPSAISFPFRKILRRYNNVLFRMGSLKEIHPHRNKIILNNGEMDFDHLVIATGSVPNFFGNSEIENNAMPMKTISDALSLRNKYLIHLERASRIENTEDRKRLLTFVIAGAGPTGVELTGMFAEMRKNILVKDYPELKDSDLGNIYLVDGNSAVLAPMSLNSQKYTKEKLEELGVVIKLKTLVKEFKDDIVFLSDGSQISSRNLIWAAGVHANTFDGVSKDSYGKGNRLITDQYNRVVGYENIYAIGDTSIMTTDSNYPNGHPQLAQVAIQQGRNLGKNFAHPHYNWKPFRYYNKGTMAMIGRNKAVADLPPKTFLKGFIAWFIWVFVHIMSLVNARNRFHTFLDWVSYYTKKDQSLRMIIHPKEQKKDSLNS